MLKPNLHLDIHSLELPPEKSPLASAARSRFVCSIAKPHHFSTNIFASLPSASLHLTSSHQHRLDTLSSHRNDHHTYAHSTTLISLPSSSPTANIARIRHVRLTNLTWSPGRAADPNRKSSRRRWSPHHTPDMQRAPSQHHGRLCRQVLWVSEAPIHHARTHCSA